MNPDSKTTTKSLAALHRGEGGVVVEIGDPVYALQLMEMGILPGEYIVVDRVAPLGDPISINIHGHMLSLRRREAATVIVEMKP